VLPNQEVAVVNRGWLVPLTGVAFIVVVFIGFFVAGEPPEADQPTREIVEHYVDDKDAVQLGALLAVIAGGLLIFFGNHLRQVLRGAEGRRETVSAVVLVGAATMAIGGAIDATISFALAEAADDIDPSGVQALQALWDNDFMPVALGAGVFLLSSGVSIVSSGALPKWLGWIAIVLGVVTFTPVGFVSFPGGAIWILIVSVMLTVRARRAGASPGRSGPAAPPGATT
jgi:hypothetical protein